jgi:ATP-dependent RNA helicase DeaD
VTKFDQLPISEAVLKAVTDLGYETPSPIQAETLPILLGEPTDFLGLAATGTGKTAAFAIPLLERIDPAKKCVQALVLCPTRELAMQVSSQVEKLGKYKRVKAATIYGGSGYAEQIQALRGGASVVVGTPGRVIDHLERGTLRLDNLSVLVLDEADEMISMGFKDELEKILSSVSKETANTWLFSATMSRDVRKVADEYLREPKEVHVNRTEMLSSTVEQYYYPTLESQKPALLCKLIEGAEDFYGLVFCQTKSLVIDLTSYLVERGYKVDCLHGDKDQPARERAMQAFRDRRATILVCTDVASRGLDVKDVTHVVNYSLPREIENYVHRIGRTARSGKAGIAMSLVTPSHKGLIRQIERHTKSQMMEGHEPSRREIGAKKIAKRLDTFLDQPYFARAIEVMSDEWKAKLAEMSPEEVAARFMTMLMPEIFNDRDQRPRQQAVADMPGPMARAEQRPAPRAERPPPRAERPQPRAERPPMRAERPPMRTERPARFEDDTRPVKSPYAQKPVLGVQSKPAFAPRTPRPEFAPRAPKPEFTPRTATVAAQPEMNRRERRALKFGQMKPNESTVS